MKKQTAYCYACCANKQSFLPRYIICAAFSAIYTICTTHVTLYSACPPRRTAHTSLVKVYSTVIGIYIYSTVICIYIYIAYSYTLIPPHVQSHTSRLPPGNYIPPPPRDVHIIRCKSDAGNHTAAPFVQSIYVSYMRTVCSVQACPVAVPVRCACYTVHNVEPSL